MKKALKQKLVKLIHYCTSCEECRNEDIADPLINNGVTVQGESFVPQIMYDRIKYHIDLQKWVHQVLFKIGDKEWEYCTDLPTELVSEAMVPEWISVKDRLPEPWKDVLAFYENKTISIDAMSDGGKWYSDYVSTNKITHWMPFPQPPKGE